VARFKNSSCDMMVERHQLRLTFLRRKAGGCDSCLRGHNLIYKFSTQRDETGRNLTLFLVSNGTRCTTLRGYHLRLGNAPRFFAVIVVRMIVTMWGISTQSSRAPIELTSCLLLIAYCLLADCVDVRFSANGSKEAARPMARQVAPGRMENPLEHNGSLLSISFSGSPAKPYSDAQAALAPLDQGQSLPILENDHENHCIGPCRPIRARRRGRHIRESRG
jgi:hypothetical protein